MARSPFRSFQVVSVCLSLFGIVSICVGVAEMMVWLFVLGVISPDRPLRIDDSYMGLSGNALALVSSAGIWCGIWVALTGFCGCAMTSGKPTEQINRLKTVLCIASATNAILFTPLQIALYGWIFVPQEVWGDQIDHDKPVWWAVLLQSLGVASGVGSFIISIINIVLTVRSKSYQGKAKTWDEIDV